TKPTTPRKPRKRPPYIRAPKEPVTEDPKTKPNGKSPPTRDPTPKVATNQANANTRANSQPTTPMHHTKLHQAAPPTTQTKTR
ncbi:MAG: hypothetical protein ACRCZI_01415, partial [Cetobacterium sp.]